MCYKLSHITKSFIDVLLFVLMIFRRLGSEWNLDPDMYSSLEAFTCAMYGYDKDTELNEIRLKMLKKMVGEGEELKSSSSKVDLTKLPPCQSNFITHLQRVNYRAAHYKRAQKPVYDAPKPSDPNQGWHIIDGALEPKWTDGLLFPQSVIDLFETIDPPDLEESDELVELDLDIDDDCDEEENYY